ncbi:MAG: OmpH family outer membrane protein [Ignavibacteriales bacterium]|nr:OmpH family outer membrane protein [Ignavibacteriales bacterium]
MGISFSIWKRILKHKLEVKVKTKLFILALFLFNALSFAQTLNGQKIGFVNTDVILEQFSEAIKAQSDLDAWISVQTAKRDSMTRALQTEYVGYQQKFETMTQEQIQAAQQSLVQQEAAIKDFEQKKFGQGGEIYQKRTELFGPIELKIRNAITEVAKSEGMNFILDKTDTLPVLLYSDDTYDITFQVLDKLKRGK